MHTTPDYFSKFAGIAMDRTDGVLDIQLHRDGGPMVWDREMHRNLPDALECVGRDAANRIVILRGADSGFCEYQDFDSFGECFSPSGWQLLMHEGERIITALLGIPVPVIGLVQGQALYHPELLLLSDIVLATPDAVLRDDGHVKFGIVPGDGIQIVWQALFGLNRGRYMLLTNSGVTAAEAHALGAVGEICAADAIRERAAAVAAQLGQMSDMTLRFTRSALIRPWRELFTADGGRGLAFEGLAALGSGQTL